MPAKDLNSHISRVEGSLEWSDYIERVGGGEVCVEQGSWIYQSIASHPLLAAILSPRQGKDIASILGQYIIIVDDVHIEHRLYG